MRKIEVRTIERRFLPHTVTVFNALTHQPGLIPVVLKYINMQEAPAFRFGQAVNTEMHFQVVYDAVNTDAGGRKLALSPGWKLLTDEEQLTGFFTLHADMWLFSGEHESFPAGEIIPAKDMTAARFSALGMRLLKTSRIATCAADTLHNIQLVG